MAIDQQRFSWTTELVTSFHIGLVTPRWLDTLADSLSERPELAGKAFVGTVVGLYDEERFMGPESVVKYKFGVNLSWALDPTSPIRVAYKYGVEYRPKTGEFKLGYRKAAYEWKEGADRSDLGERLLALGILRETTLSPDEIPPSMRELVMAGQVNAFDHTIIPIAHVADLLTVAISEPSLITELQSICSWPRDTIVEPVLVRDRDLLRDLAGKLYGEKIEVEEVQVRSIKIGPNLAIVTQDHWRAARDQPPESLPVYRVAYRRWGCRLTLSFAPRLILVDLLNSGATSYAIGRPTPEAWRELELLAGDHRVWNPEVRRQGLDGQEWHLEYDDSKEVRRLEQWYPPGSPFLEFCLAALTLAGLELELDRHKHWSLTFDPSRRRSLPTWRPQMQRSATPSTQRAGFPSPESDLIQ